jgi:PKHD-type hydroxylase
MRSKLLALRRLACGAAARGERLASFFWIESLVRDDAQRTLLYESDGAIQRLAATGADEDARVILPGCYHNLLRQWAHT